MNQFLSFISDVKVVVVIFVLLLALVAWLIVQRFKTVQFKKELTELEERYNALKSIPISLKMNKAVAISRVDQQTAQKVADAKRSYDGTQADISRIANQLAEAEDEILVGKLGKADKLLTDLETDLTLTENDARSLDGVLDDILSRETEQRQGVNILKNRFRILKSQAQENSQMLSYSWDLIEKKIGEIEKSFSTFEEWMYSNDYDNANHELEIIAADLDELEVKVNEMPSLLEDARGVIPKMAENLQHDYIVNRNRGVYLKHLEIERQLNILAESLRTDLNKLKEGVVEGVRESLDSYKERINQLDEAVFKETESFNNIQKIAGDINAIQAETEANAAFVKQAIASNAGKFDLTATEEEFNNCRSRLASLNNKKPAVFSLISSANTPATVITGQLQQLNDQYGACNDSFKEMRSRLEAAAGDEDRIRKQLVKLQIVMNQMEVKVRKYKLPSISDTFDADMRKAQEYIARMKSLVNESPLNMQLLVAVQQEALDFIYTLYNNVNNTVGSVMMVENTIVFGNRYRSTYPDIDSELTRSELCFRNGEYTQALEYAIGTIEKIHPGNYESMIRENAKGAQ